jgi:hypothetical protein
MVHDVVSVTKEVARSVSSCGNFCSPIQNIVMTGNAQFQDAGKCHLQYAAAVSKSLFALVKIYISFLWRADYFLDFILGI